MELVHETRWSRHYSFEEMQTRLYQSKFADGSATISMEQLEAEWPAWRLEDKLDFCQAVTAAKFSHLPDVLRFVMQNGDFDLWSEISAWVVRLLPAQESIPFIVEKARQSPIGKGWKFFAALALSNAPEAIPTLRDCLHRIWSDPRLFAETGYFNAVANDATACLENLLLLQDRSPELTDKYNQLITHPIALNRQNAVTRLSPYFS
jgi:hypothetical protein